MESLDLSVGQKVYFTDHSSDRQRAGIIMDGPTAGEYRIDYPKMLFPGSEGDLTVWLKRHLIRTRR